MRDSTSTYGSDLTEETVSEQIVVPSEWTEIEETRPLAFVYVLVALVLGVVATVWATIYLLK